MNTYTNDDYFAAQLLRARRFRTYGVLAVITSFVLSLLASSNIWLIYLAYPFLLAGFPLWTYGRSLQRRLTQSPRPDKVIDGELKGLSNKYSIFHYATVEGRLIKHLLAMPGGLLVMESSDSTGPVKCGSKGGQDRWQSRSGWLDRVSGMNPPVGNPTLDLQASVAAARNSLAAIGKPGVPVMGLVVFTRNPEIEVEGCEFEALPVEELKETVRGIQYELGGERGEGLNISRVLTSDDRRRLTALLAPSAPQPASQSKPTPTRRKEVEKV